MCVSSCLVTANEAKKLSSNVKRRAAHGSDESMRIKAYRKVIKDYFTHFAATPSKDQMFDQKGYILGGNKKKSLKVF